MGIRLDWDVESDQKHTYDVQEDPQVIRERRRARIRLLFVILFLAGILGGLGALVIWRVEQTDAAVERVLRDTVDAEVTALRFGDWQAFFMAQRSATDDWYQQQRNYFDTYQNIKLTNNLEFTGEVLDVSIDGTRARVTLEEIIDDVPFAQVWFYWRYEDGWRHVPPDYTFWGDPAEYQGRKTTVYFEDVDEKLALDLGVAFESWIDSACAAILQCGDLPHINVHIEPNPDLRKPEWDAQNRWQLNIPSPYVARARQDVPFSGQLKVDTANALAERLVEVASASSDAPVYPRDAYYLRPAVASWLTGLFADVDTNSHLIASLAANYGRDAVGNLLQILMPDSSVEALRQLTGVGRLDEANLDWRDYLTWRLQLERELRTRNDEAAFLTLYTAEMADIARERYRGAPPAERANVIEAEKGLAVDGVPQIRATVRYGNGEGAAQEDILFRLIEGTWKRAN